MTEAYFGGGCFWCTEAIFSNLKGVTSVTSGYAGGTTPHPTYEDVCSGATGHAEVVKVTFDPQQITYPQLLDIFFTTHNPTTPNRQGADVGTQYRSLILYADAAQKRAAHAAIDRFTQDQAFAQPIVTEIAPLTDFYPAEESHRDYYRRHQSQLYCQIVINPKLKKLREKYASLLAPSV